MSSAPHADGRLGEEEVRREGLRAEQGDLAVGVVALHQLEVVGRRRVLVGELERRVLGADVDVLGDVAGGVGE